MSDTFSSFARTLKSPDLAVIFVTPRTAGYPHYGYMTESMVEFAAKQPGCLGVKTSEPVNGFSTTMSFWSSEEAIKAWEMHMDNKPAGYEIRVVKVEDNYDKKPVA